MMHTRYERGKIPLKNWKPVADYASFMDYQRAALAPANSSFGSGFWRAMADLPYTCKQMQEPKIIREMQKEFNKKYNDHGAATIVVGRALPHFVVLITSTGTYDHAYLFFRTAKDEMQNELARTFNLSSFKL